MKAPDKPNKSNAGRKKLPEGQKVLPKHIYPKEVQWKALEELAAESNKTVTELIVKRFNLPA